MNKFFNEYNLKARAFPALISALPILLFKHYVADKYFSLSLLLIISGDVSILIVVIYLMIQVNRFISKMFFEKKSDFYSDQALLPSNNFLSNEYKKNIAKKIHQDFKLYLPTLADEKTDIRNAKLRIREIVQLIVGKIKDGNLLLQHNIEYGFTRNLIGGSTIALLISMMNVILSKTKFPNEVYFLVSLLSSFLFFGLLIFHKTILKHYSEEYMHILFREYLQSDKKP